MIPLSSTENTQKFPKTVVCWILFLVGLHLFSYFFKGPRIDFLFQFSTNPNSTLGPEILSSFLFPHAASLLIAIIYSWAFFPRLFEKIPPVFAFALALLGSWISGQIFLWIHAQTPTPLLLSDAFLGVLLGMAMRHDLWGSVYTLVIGPLWVRVLEVPSYVLLFFWLFYIFLCSFGLSSPFAEARMLYLLPLLGFLWGFLIESLRLLVIRQKASS